MERKALFEFHMLPLEQPDPVEPSQRARPPTPALLHHAAQPTRNLAIYVQTGFMGAPLTGRHDYRPLALALDDVSCSLLVLQSSAARRSQYVKFDTCVNDIRSGLDWAKARGFENIVLIGVSLGSARVSYWNAVAPDPAVKAMVFLAAVNSVYLGNSLHWTPEQRQRQDAALQQCRDLIAAGRGEELIVSEFAGYLFPMTAAAYLSYFGQLGEMNASALKFADKITVPIVLIHGTKDTVCPPQGGQAVYDALSAAPHKELVWIQGADHQLMTIGSSAALVSAKIADFVAKNLSSPPIASTTSKEGRAWR